VTSEVLGEAWDIYRRLWRRSVVVAGLVFAVVSLGSALAGSSRSLSPLLVSLVLSLLGSLLVQGALVEVVRDLHEGRAPARLGEYYSRTRAVLGTLVGVSFLAAIGIDGEVVATPGHSDDSVSLVLDEGAAFTGDLTPLSMAEPHNAAALESSWRRLRQLGVTIVYPGHGSPRPI